MCGKEYEKFYTIRGAESTRCEGCQNTMRTIDAKREDRVRSYKVENMKNTERHYKQYYMSAHKRSYAFELTLDEFSSLVGQPCYHCNYFKEGEANGIDRVDNSKGYSISNCLPCCEMCNRMKHVYHLDFFLAKMKQISNNAPPSSEFTLIWKDYYPKETVRYNKYKYDSERRGVPLNLTEDQYNEIIPNFKDYNIILQVTKRKQINFVHKFLEVICEYLSQLMVLFGFVYESKLS
jgi:ribosomal protein L34E